jgi:spore germination protein GerM
MRRRIIAIAAAIVVLAAACGIPDGGQVQRIDQVPFELGDTVPTTTTSTTTTILETSTSSAETSTTIATEPVRLYFVAGAQLANVSITLPSPASLAQVMSALQAGPPAGQLGTGLRSPFPTRSLVFVTDDGSGVAAVDLPAGFFDDVTTTDQRLVVAQIVLTLSARPGIGQVLFTQAGSPLAVPLGSGQLSEPDQRLSRRDYEALLSTSTSPPPTTFPGDGVTLTTAPPQP